MKKTSPDLFTLIKSLSKSEKRHFTIFASKHVIGEQNNYMRLFQAIDAQDEYDEELIRQEFKGETFLKQLAVTKNYLYNLILKSLRAYHSGRSVDMQLQELLLDIELLHEKALYEQCRKLIAKAKELAYTHIKYLFVLHILDWQRRFIDSGTYSEKEIEAFYGEEQEILKKLHNSSEYDALSLRAFSLHRKVGIPRTEDEQDQFRRLASHELLESEEKALSDDARIRYNNIKALIAQWNLSYDDYYNHCKRAAEIIESRKLFTEKEISTYVNRLHNFVHACYMVQRYDELFEALSKLRTLSKNSPNLHVRTFSTTFAIETMVLREMGEIRKGIEFVEQNQEELLRLEGKISRGEELLMYFNVAELYFADKNFKKTLHWLNKILNSYDIERREDLHCSAKIFALIVHFELGDTDYLDYSVKSVYRFLHKRNKIQNYEKSILDFIRTLPKISTHTQLMNGFKDLHSKLVALRDDPNEPPVGSNFNIVAWLESKIENVSIAELTQRKRSSKSLSRERERTEAEALV